MTRRRCRAAMGLALVAASLPGCSADETPTGSGVPAYGTISASPGGPDPLATDEDSNAPNGADPGASNGVGGPNASGAVGDSEAGPEPGGVQGPPAAGAAAVTGMGDDGSCAAGRVACGGACVDLASNGQHCGACGNICGARHVCSGGACTPTCVEGLSTCDGSCVDTSGSPEHCGGCGQACPADQTCWQGSCRCPTGQAACDGTCGDVLSNLQDCGACGNVCADGAACIGGSCVCPDFGAACNGTCRTILSDPNNCGTCGNTCGGGTECSFGGCVDPNSTDCGGNGTQIDRTCTRDATLDLGRYWVNNNQWGADIGAPGEQCIWSTCQNGDLVGWGTDWDWGTFDQFQVKSFVSLVQGWQWGNRLENTGLPARIADTSAINCGWNFDVQTNGVMSVTFDLFLHNVPDPDYQTDPTDEVMIWPYRAGGAGPLGSQQATVNLEGTTWNLFVGTHPVWENVFSFVRAQTTTTAVIDVMDFMGELVDRGMITPNKYISTIQTGTEIFVGNGSLQTNGYFCRVRQ